MKAANVAIHGPANTGYGQPSYPRLGRARS